MKNKLKKLVKFIKSVKYEILMTCEILALIGALIYCLFGRNKQFSLLTAVSALIGAYISTRAIYSVGTRLNTHKYIDIISAMKHTDNNESVEQL